MESDTTNQQGAPVQNTSQEPLVSTPVSNQKGFAPIILGVVILLIVVAGGAYFFGLKQDQKNQEISQQLPTPPSLTPIVSAVPEVKEYKTRYYNTTDVYFDKEKYPVELTSVADSQLTPIYCTRTYSGYGEDYSSYDETTQKSTPLTDPSLLTYIRSLAKKYEGKKVNEIYTCAPKEGKTIVVYSLGPCGGGCSGLPYIGIANNAGEIQETGKMMENMAYFGCRKPLQLANDNNFYFSCGGGDGPGASASIYKLSLNNLTTSRIKHCEMGIDESGKSYSRCQ